MSRKKRTWHKPLLEELKEQRDKLNKKIERLERDSGDKKKRNRRTTCLALLEPFTKIGFTEADNGDYKNPTLEKDEVYVRIDFTNGKAYCHIEREVDGYAIQAYAFEVNDNNIKNLKRKLKQIDRMFNLELDFIDSISSLEENWYELSLNKIEELASTLLSSIRKIQKMNLTDSLSFD